MNDFESVCENAANQITGNKLERIYFKTGASWFREYLVKNLPEKAERNLCLWYDADEIDALLGVNTKESLMEITTQDAVKKLVKELLSDDGFRHSWEANIAMAFKDQASWDKRDWNKDHLHETANKASKYFINVLCNIK